MEYITPNTEKQQKSQPQNSNNKEELQKSLAKDYTEMKFMNHLGAEARNFNSFHYVAQLLHVTGTKQTHSLGCVHSVSVIFRAVPPGNAY